MHASFKWMICYTLFPSSLLLPCGMEFTINFVHTHSKIGKVIRYEQRWWMNEEKKHDRKEQSGKRGDGGRKLYNERKNRYVQHDIRCND